MEGLLWLLAFGVFFYFMMRHGCGAHMVHGSHHGSRNGEDGNKDPVCGMMVAVDAGYTKVHEGVRHAFCSKDCLDKFEADPARYVNRAAHGRSA